MTKSRIVMAIFMAICVVFFARPIFSEDSYEVRYTAEFSVEELSFHKIMGYDMVRLEQAGHLTELGKPMLPSKEIKIALPAGMAVKSVQVVNTIQEEITGEFNIFPAQPPIRIGLSDGDVYFVEPDQNT